MIASKERISRKSPHPVLPFFIRRDGVWFYKGRALGKKAMRCLLGSLLTRDEEGAYWLDTLQGKGVIDVEDAPFLGVELHFRGRCHRYQQIFIRTNVDELLLIGPDHPVYCNWENEGNNLVYVHVRDGSGRFPLLARLTRSVLFEMGALGSRHILDGRECLGVWSADCFFPLSPVP